MIQTPPSPSATHNARLGNVERQDGVDRCYCGCKYWENDRCVDCGGTEPEAMCEECGSTDEVVECSVSSVNRCIHCRTGIFTWSGHRVR